MFALTIAR